MVDLCEEYRQSIQCYVRWLRKMRKSGKTRSSPQKVGDTIHDSLNVKSLPWCPSTQIDITWTPRKPALNTAVIASQQATISARIVVIRAITMIAAVAVLDYLLQCTSVSIGGGCGSCLIGHCVWKVKVAWLLVGKWISDRKHEIMEQGELYRALTFRTTQQSVEPMYAGAAS